MGRYAAPVPPAQPRARTVALPAGLFRLLEWPGRNDATVVFLHGLSGVAEVWDETVAALDPDRPRCIALDQRGHGHSPRTPGHYAATDYLGDLVSLVEQLDGPIHLVGHSMGARVAILAAARHPEAFASIVIVDIGPEAWKANITETSRLFASMPQRFDDRDAALSLIGLSKRGDEWANRFVDSRLRVLPDGSYSWLAAPETLIETVTTQRARNYWTDWDRISSPALLIRGGTSKELRPRIVAAMRRRNPSVKFTEIPDVGHNIPMDAPTDLAEALRTFWVSA